MSPRDALQEAIIPALDILPAPMTSTIAKVLLLAIGLQESRLDHRYQVLEGTTRKGPARGFWQFELGTRASRGGCWGVWLHPASRYWLNELCKECGCEFTPRAIWTAIETDDILAAGVARLLLFTDPRSLPAMGEVDAAWSLYLRTWRPGKPRPKTWPENYHRALDALN